MLNEARKGLLNILRAHIQKAETETQRQIGMLGKRIEQVDRLVVHLLAGRKELAEMVVCAKLKTGERIYNPDREKKRLGLVSRWAEEEGLSPEFARSLQFLIMSESRNIQVAILEAHRLGELIPKQLIPLTFEELRANLLTLTMWWSSRYDAEYDKHSVAARLHREFESELISEAISELPHREVLLDLGCATGKETLLHTHGFKHRIGYDISPEMVAVASQKASAGKLKNVSFQVQDLEAGLPLDDESVSFLYLNQGTASDIRNITGLLTEAARVLKSNGGFLLSFYNKDALLYRSFLPWPPNLLAEFSHEKDRLDVRYFVEKEEEVEDEVKGEKKKVQKLILQKLPIFARAYTVQEVQQFLPSPLECSGVYTHPTLSSVLPLDIFQEEKVRELIKHLDKELASSVDHLGAYIVLTGIKT